jgi:CheY-like chemotaxis protein
MNTDEAILLVEDNEDDMFFMQRAMKAAALSNPVFVVQDGEEAIEYLSGSGRFSNRKQYPIPALVFLDLKLPVRNGLEVLEWARSQDELRRVVFVVLTSSQEPTDLRRAYAIGANSYLVKPSQSQQLEALMRAVKHYWLELNVFDI